MVCSQQFSTCSPAAACSSCALSRFAPAGLLCAPQEAAGRTPQRSFFGRMLAAVGGGPADPRTVLASLEAEVAALERLRQALHAGVAGVGGGCWTRKEPGHAAFALATLSRTLRGITSRASWHSCNHHLSLAHPPPTPRPLDPPTLLTTSYNPTPPLGQTCWT